MCVLVSLSHSVEGAQSDSEIYHPNESSLDRGYTSDSEVYADHSKQGKMHRSVTDVDVVNSGWLVVRNSEECVIPHRERLQKLLFCHWFPVYWIKWSG